MVIFIFSYYFTLLPDSSFPVTPVSWQSLLSSPLNFLYLNLCSSSIQLCPFFPCANRISSQQKLKSSLFLQKCIFFIVFIPSFKYLSYVFYFKQSVFHTCFCSPNLSKISSLLSCMSIRSPTSFCITVLKVSILCCSCSTKVEISVLPLCYICDGSICGIQTADGHRRRVLSAIQSPYVSTGECLFEGQMCRNALDALARTVGNYPQKRMNQHISTRIYFIVWVSTHHDAYLCQTFIFFLYIECHFFAK